MNKQIMEAIDHMTEKGYSADFIARATQLLKEMYTKKEGEKNNENERKHR